MRLRTQSFLMDSTPLISASLYPALDFVETGENLVGQTVDLGQVPLYLLHTLVMICTDCCGTELVELLMADTEGLEFRHTTVRLLAFAEVPFSEAAYCMVLDIGCVELDIAPHHLVHPHSPDHGVGLCKFDHFLPPKAAF